MIREEAKALLDNILPIISVERLDLMVKHHPSDFFLETSAVPQPSVGFDGLRTWLHNVFTTAPDHHITFNEFYVDGNVIFTSGQAREQTQILAEKFRPQEDPSANQD